MTRAARIHKEPVRRGLVPNWTDYAQERSRFSWDQARLKLQGLPGGGLNMGFEAVDRHAAGVLRYRHCGKGRELTLGQYPDVSLKLARQRASEARAEVQAGRADAGTARVSGVGERCRRTRNAALWPDRDASARHVDAA